MNYEPLEYQKLVIRQFPARSLRETAEGKYWKRFKAPVLTKEIGAVTHLDFCQHYPFDLAVTSSTRVLVYDSRTSELKRTFARFKDKAYSGCFRPGDGKLLVAGSEDGVVQVFDANSRSVLRQFKGHHRATHVARFAPDRSHVLSGGDDVTVRWWDVTTGSQVARFDGHADYVRAAAVSPTAGDTWATGGYDHACKLWDARSGRCVMDLDHGAPIEDLQFFTSGSLLVTAGGSSLCVWDLVGGGRLLKRLSNFQKTVTCVAISPLAGPESSAAPRMLAGSLDGHVKIFELNNFKVTHATKYPAPVMSLALSPNCGTLAVGMADGTLSMRHHARPKAVAGVGVPVRRQRYKPRLTAANYRYFIRGQSERAGADDFAVQARAKANLQLYDRLLRRFRCGEALDAALQASDPAVVSSVIEELTVRGGLNAAIGGRDAERLLPLLAHLAKYIGEPRHTRQLVGVAHRVLDAYAEVIGSSEEVDHRLAVLKERVMAELRTQETLAEIQGMLEPILAGAMAGLMVS